MSNSDLNYLFSNRNKPFILDGAMGSLLQQKGYKPDKNLWMSYLNFKSPDVIKNIHIEYIKAGCDIITTNTFRTNPIAIKSTIGQLDIEAAVKKSVDISRIIADEYNVLVAGSNAPAEDCYQKERRLSSNELKTNHKKHIDLLYENGIDFVLNETQSHMDEIKIICEHCFNNNIPYVISLLITDELKILSGEKLSEVVEFILNYKPLVISFNCFNENIFNKLLQSININYDWGFYLNCGSGDYNDSKIVCGLDEMHYAEVVEGTLNLKPKLVGACCGSNPKHIERIKKLFDETYNN